MQIHYLENLATAGIGNIAEWAQARGHRVVGTRLHESARFPAIDDIDMLVVLGGVPRDCAEWFNEEIAFVREVIAAGKAVLGICLGSQLIAEALGGKLVPALYAESGWWPVTLRESARAHPLMKDVPQTNTLFFFHQNTFTMPESCVWLAQTEACAHQIYAYGDRVLAIQAHPEFMAANVAHLAAHKATSLPPGPYNAITAADIERNEAFANAKAMLFCMLDNLEAAQRSAARA